MLNMGFLGVRIDEDLEKAIKATGRPRSEVVRDALRMYLELEPGHVDYGQLIKDIERLLDEKLKIATKPVLNNVKHESLNNVKHESLNNVKHESLNNVKQAPLNTVKQSLNDVKQPEEDQLKHVLQVLLDLHDQGIEPTSTDLAERVGMNARPMGTLLSQHGIKTKATRRSGKSGRFFTFDLREKIEELIAEGEHDK